MSSHTSFEHAIINLFRGCQDFVSALRPNGNRWAIIFQIKSHSL